MPGKMKSKYAAKAGGTPMKTKYMAKGGAMKTKYASAGGKLSGMTARRNARRTK
jgi:hypothetical protein